MKKFSIVLLLAALFASFSAHAKFSIGPKLGVNINKLTFSEKIIDSKNRCGFTGGLQAEYIAPILGIGADISLMYAYMNTELNNQDVHGHFFEIPLHLKYKLGIPAIESIFAPYLFTGPSVAFKFGGENSYGHTKKTQWGWDLGLGFEFIKHLQIGAGYTFGINNVMKYTSWGQNASNDIKVKNNYWTITAAWMF